MFSANLTKMLKHRILTREEELQLLTNYLEDGCIKSRDKLVSHNIRLVVNISLKQIRYISNAANMDDLVQWGIIGLIRAINKTDLSLGNRLSTYSSMWIMQEIQREGANCKTTIRLPIHVNNKVNYYRKGYDKYLQSDLSEDVHEFIRDYCIGLKINIFSTKGLNKIPTTKDIAKALTMYNHITNIASEVKLDGDFIPIFDVISVDQTLSDPYNDILQEKFSENIISLLDNLTSTEKTVIIHRYGLNNNTQKTLTEVSGIINLTRERVRQIQVKALSKLKSRLEQGITKSDFI